MFQSLRGRLLFSYLMVMGLILALFSTGVHILFRRNLENILDNSLKTTAQLAAARAENQSFNSQDWEQIIFLPKSNIFTSEEHSLEWFDLQGQLLGSKGPLQLAFPPRVGYWSLKRQKSAKRVEIHTFTIRVTDGYIRVSQSTEKLELLQTQLLWGLVSVAMVTLVLVGLGGLWLTQKALQPIEQSYTQLKQFTADVSHELRSPLTAIKASLDVIRNHPERIHPKDARKLAAIASATTQMIRLTEDLLFLARTEVLVRQNSQLTQQWQQIALEELLQDCTELLEPLATEKQITFQYQCLAKISLIADPGQLHRLFANLVQNAILYTPSQGKIMVSLEKQNRYAVVSIKDTGMGISEAQLPLIFKRFWRADKARSHRAGGSGLGLAIASAIVKLHGGKITVTSKVGIGSCFQVYLPIAAGNVSKSR